MTREFDGKPVNYNDSPAPTQEIPIYALDAPWTLQRILRTGRRWLQSQVEAFRSTFNRLLKNRFFTAGLLWALTIIGNLLLLPNIGVVLLLGTIAAAVIRSGLNPFTTVVLFVIAIFVIPARFALLGMSTSMAIGLAALCLWLFHRMANGPIQSERHHRMDRWILIFLVAKLIAYVNAQLHFRTENLVASADRQILVLLAFAGIALYLSLIHI